MPQYCVWNLTLDRLETSWCSDAYFVVGMADYVRKIYAQRGYRLEVRRESDEETAERLWRERERMRFIHGSYQPVPWCNEKWTVPDHFAHASTKDPMLLAYTPDSKYGLSDRQVSCKPGRYLAKLGLGNEEIKRWCDAWALAFGPVELRITASDPDEIERVYLNGPSSCMSHPERDYSGPCHPVRVYGAGDLCVAYLGDADGDVSARALCWPERKVYGRVYGDEGKLVPLLEAAGYVRANYGAANFAGARLLRIEDADSGAFVAPYLDSPHNSVFDDGKFLRIDGDISAQETCGLTDDTRARCCHCGDRFNAEDSGYSDDDGDDWCDDCYCRNFSTCARCEETTHNDCLTRVGDEDWCDDCARNHSFECSGCDGRFSDDDMHEHEGDDYCEACLPEPDEDEKTAEHEPSPTIHDPRQMNLLDEAA